MLDHLSSAVVVPSKVVVANHAESAEGMVKEVKLVTCAVAPNNTLSKDYAGRLVSSQ